MGRRKKKDPPPDDPLVCSADTLLVSVENYLPTASRWYACVDNLTEDTTTLKWVLVNTLDGGYVAAGLSQKQREYLIFVAYRCTYRFVMALQHLAWKLGRANDFPQWKLLESRLLDAHEIMSHIGDCEELVRLEEYIMESILPEAYEEIHFIWAIARIQREAKSYAE